MFDFGITGYRPGWLQGLNPIAATHRRRLAGLVGRTLHHVWLVWDLRADEWFSDCPVVLDFGDEHVEINHQKFDDLSITFNSIDPRQPVTWPTSDDFQLAWRAEPIERLEEFRGQRLRQAELLEYAGGTVADGSIALWSDLIDGPWAHQPSGIFAANAAWTVLAALAHNLLRAAGTSTGVARYAVARGATLREHLVNVPARLARPQRRPVLHLPTHWPRANAWLQLWTAVFTT